MTQEQPWLTINLETYTIDEIKVAINMCDVNDVDWKTYDLILTNLRANRKAAMTTPGQLTFSTSASFGPTQVAP